MKNILFLGLIGLLFLSINTQAQDRAGVQLLDRVSARYLSYNSAQADFTLKISNVEAEINEMTSGSVIMSGDKYRIDTDEIARISDGTSIWTHFKEDEEVQINEFNPDEEELNPAEFFTLYKKDYTVFSSKEFEEEGTQYLVVDLRPNDADSHPYRKVNLYVDRENLIIQRALVHDKNGSVYTYIINEFKYDVDINDKMFMFKPEDYDDIDVIDLR